LFINDLYTMKYFNIVFVITYCLLSINLFAQPLSFNYISPLAGSEYINPEQTIILKTGEQFDISSIKGYAPEFQGEKSSTLKGSFYLSKDQKTLFIKAEKSFAYGEKVSISIPDSFRTMSGKSIEGINLSFTIKAADNLDLLIEYYENEEIAASSGTSGFGNRPEYKPLENNYPEDYPTAMIQTYGEPTDGYLFFNPTAPKAQTLGNYLSIVDYFGIPVFYMKEVKRINDFKIMPDGKLVYAYNNPQNSVTNGFRLMDSAFFHLDTIRMGNGYVVNGHDFKQFDNGHYLMMAYDPQPVDMSLVVPGGDTNATVVGFIVQEVDNEANVYFQWRSWDHFEITDATDDQDLLGNNIDYVHGNAFEIDLDGNILLCCRHMDEITKIDSETGEIIWRMGLKAKNNEFTFLNDTLGFSHMHDIQVLENGNYTMFDNGNLHDTPVSRAREYEVNEETMEVSLAWNYGNDPAIYGRSRGGYDELENGNALISWGSHISPGVSEVTREGEVLMELHFPDSIVMYRCHRHPWKTTRFTSDTELIDFENYYGYVPIYRNFNVHNPGPDTLDITSSHNHLEHFGLATPLPYSIPPGESFNLVVSFSPVNEGGFEDVLTINSDNKDNTMRIAIQIKLKGEYDTQGPTVEFIPEDGSTDVSPETEIILSFDEPVRKNGGAEITDLNISSIVSLTEVSSTENIEFTGAINEEKSEINIIPVERLSVQEQYIILIDGNIIEDFYGNVKEVASSASFTTIDDTGVDDGKMPEFAKVSPNPSSGIFMIHSEEKPIKSISIFSQDGKQILAFDNIDDVNYSINIESEATGIYYLKLEFEFANPQSIRIIKK